MAFLLLVISISTGLFPEIYTLLLTIMYIEHHGGLSLDDE